MAEAPSNPGSSQEADQPGSSQAPTAPADDMETESATGTDSGSASEQAVNASPSATPSPAAKSQKEQVAAILESPAASGIYNSDSMSRVFALDQDYTARGDNGLTAKFTFNPSSDAVFTNTLVEVEIEGYIFEFEPVNRSLFTGQNSEGSDVYLLVGDATYVYDEFGKKWSESDLGMSRVRIEVAMESNGTTVKSVNLALYSR
jgi:hypothetical protein